MKIDGANLLEGVIGNEKQDEIRYGTVSINNSAGLEETPQQSEKLSKGEQVAEVIYQKPQQEKKSGTADDVMQQAENMNTAQMKDKMVVASHTTTAEDCKKVENDGFSLDQTEIETIVTVTDKIKLELAKAGKDVSYFTDGLSAEQLEEMTGDVALAQELAVKLKQADLPLNAENIEDCMKAIQEAGGLHHLSDGALKYMLDNGLEPTIANLYKAQYSGSAGYSSPDAGQIDLSGMEEQISRVIAQSGRADDEQAMPDSRWLIQNQIPLTAKNLKELDELKSLELPKDTDAVLDAIVTAIAEGKKPQDAALLEGYSLKDQARRVVDIAEQATEEDLAYLVSKKEAVTIENLEWAHAQADTLSVQEKEDVAQLIKSTADADADKIMQSAVAGVDQTAKDAENVNVDIRQAADSPADGATDNSAVQEIAGAGENEQSLSHINAQMQTAADTVQSVDAKEGADAAGTATTATVNSAIENSCADGTMHNGAGDFAQDRNSQYTQMQLQLQFIIAHRQLEEVRLIMTQDAAYSMLKQGISVNISSMKELIDQLKELENSFYRNLLTQGGVEATEANVSLFAETSEKIEQLKEMPAYALGMWNIESGTLEELHQSGSEMQQNFQQANERYETMQTEVRKDLGDSIQKAFQNVDDILQSLDLETSAANERAVRILGYNSIEITHESILRMKAADQQVQMAFHNLTPAVVREFIARGVNPLDMDVAALNQQAVQIKAELNIDAEEEKYSEYLYKLEQNQSITQEERSSYIGIYRLMNQVAQSDGAAVGALVNQGAQLTMRNLLAAVRSEKHGKIDVSVDNSFGELQSGGYQDSITDQIEAGYQDQCMKRAMDEISPERLRTVKNETQWEDLTPEQFLQKLQEAPEDLAAEEQYYQQKLEDYVRCTEAPKEVYQLLEEYELPHTMLNMLAASELMCNRNGAYRRLFASDNGRRPDADISADEYMSQNADGSVDVDFEAIKAELLERFSEDVKRPEGLAKAMAELAECAEKCMSTMILEPDVSSLDIRELKLMSAQISISSKMASSECFSMPIVVDGEVTNVTLKIVRGKEQKGLVNITLETTRFGKIGAELKAKQEGVTGYIVTDSRQGMEWLRFAEKEITEELQQYGQTDLHFTMSSRLDLNQFASQGAQSEEPESQEAREVQTKTLYGMAEGFIRILRQLDVRQNQ